MNKKDFDLEKELGEFAHGKAPENEEKTEDEKEIEKNQKTEEIDEEEFNDVDKDLEEEETEESDEDEEIEDDSKSEESESDKELLRQMKILQTQYKELQTKLSADEKEEKQEPVKIEIDDLDDETFEKITDDPKEFKKYLLNFGSKVAEAAREEALRSIPSMVEKQTKEKAKATQSAERFYKKNPDLVKYRDFVGYKANKIKSENPELDLDDILEKTEREVRQELNIEKQAKSKKKKSPLPRRTSKTRKKGIKPSEFSKDLDKILNLD
jgi:lipopolysaccharide biosynthesis regulator YciM